MIRRSLRFFGLVTSATALALAFEPMVPPALLAYEVLSQQGDPVAVADFRLRQLPPEMFLNEMELAVAENDFERAASLLAVAEDLTVPVDPALRQRVIDAQAFDAKRTFSEFWDGLADGDASTGAGLGGTLAADLTGVGDVRDLWREGGAYLKGEEYDQVVLVLATAGVALTVGTVASVGAALPARTGLTVLKAAKKAGSLPKPLIDEFVTLSKTAIDREAVEQAVQAARWLDVEGVGTAAGRILRPKEMAILQTAAQDVASIAKTGGYRALHQSLALAESTADLTKMRKLAEAKGNRFLGVVRVLGKTAWKLGELAFGLASVVLAALGWLLVALFVTSRAAYMIARWLARTVWWAIRRTWRESSRDPSPAST